VRYTLVIQNAAFGHEVRKVSTTTKPIVLHFTDENGVRQQRLEMVTETRIETYQEFDWRAALEWLKRRRPQEWGDHVHMDLDREIAQLIAELQDIHATRERETV